MKAFVVRYNGLWLGGKAVVLAEDENEAKQLVRQHRLTVDFEDVEVDAVPHFEQVLYNDNGNY